MYSTVIWCSIVRANRDEFQMKDKIVSRQNRLYSYLVHTREMYVSKEEYAQRQSGNGVEIGRKTIFQCNKTGSLE